MPNMDHSVRRAMRDQGQKDEAIPNKNSECQTESVVMVVEQLKTIQRRLQVNILAARSNSSS